MVGFLLIVWLIESKNTHIDPSSISSKKPRRSISSLFYNARLYRASVIFVLILVICLSFVEIARASIFAIFGTDARAEELGEQELSSQNSQTLPVLLAQATPLSEKSPDPQPVPLLEQDALSAVTGPLGTQADLQSIEEIENAEISFYVVRSGDSLKAVAEMFEIKPETIVWANGLSGVSAKLKVGETLMIPPVDGVVYKIKKGDTIQKVAKEFGASTSEIEKWNGFESGYKLAIGETIMVPNGKIAPKKVTPKSNTNSILPNINLPSINEGRIGVLLARVSGPDLGNYFARPCINCYRTQGIHGRTAVDLGGKIGTPILASAPGRVIIAKDSGYNWGYAKFVVIEHPNGTQTLYAHMHKTLVSVGQQVAQGETIGLLGNTGHSTGPHLHFEVRGAKNPLGSNPNYGL